MTGELGMKCWLKPEIPYNCLISTWKSTLRNFNPRNIVNSVCWEAPIKLSISPTRYRCPSCGDTNKRTESRFVLLCIRMWIGMPFDSTSFTRAITINFGFTHDNTVSIPNESSISTVDIAKAKVSFQKISRRNRVVYVLLLSFREREKNAFGENGRVDCYCMGSCTREYIKVAKYINKLITIIYRYYCDFRYNRCLLLSQAFVP